MRRYSSFCALGFTVVLAATAANLAVAQTGHRATASSASAISAPVNNLKVFEPKWIDSSVDPCNNFYQYSCNGWFKAHPLPADETSYGRFTELSILNSALLRGILEEASVPRDSRTPDEQKIGDAYATCMDEGAIDAKGQAPLQPELDHIAALSSKDQLPVILARLQSQEVNAFFGAGSAQDYANANNVILTFAAGGLGLPERDFYTRTDAKSVEQRKQYVTHVVTMLKLSGEGADQATKDAEAILGLETKLALQSLTNVEQRDPQNLDHPTTLDTFEKTLPHFNLAAYLDELKPPASAKINVTEPKFYQGFDQVIASTDLPTIKAYLRWQYLHGVAGIAAPKAFDDENFHFYGQILRGAQTQQPRWRRCTRVIDRELGEALGQVYVAKYFPPQEKERALEMTRNIEAAMERDINQLTWMSPATKKAALVKLHAVANKVGYPDKWRDYSALTIIRGDALGNQTRAREFENRRDLNKIGKPVDRTEWGMTPPTVNAYYDPQNNDVNFPAGYFQGPFFSITEDDAANYGDMGSTIGHELTHGFDDEGRRFDAQGNLKDWWTKEDEANFKQRTECVVKQFDAQYPVPDAHVNGQLTLGEDIADIGGTLLAYMAWKENAQTQHVDLTAKTGGFTPEQRFWIAYAQQWCTDTRPEALRTRVQTDPHAPDEYRTNVIVQDLPEFGHAFSCKQGSAMMPGNTCRVW